MQSAIKSYQQAIKIKPDYANVYNNLGTALNHKGEVDSALTNYLKAIELNPCLAETYPNIAMTVKGLEFNWPNLAISNA